MNPKTLRAVRILALAPLVAPAACLSPSSPPTIQYYSALSPAEVEAPADGRTEEASAPAVTERTELWLRRVGSAEHLQQRFVWSDGGVEYGFRELVRWTEPPAEYVRKALEHELFDEAFRPSDANRALSLEVEVREFEERVDGTRRARVALKIRLSDSEDLGLVDRLVVSETPIPADGDAAATARAMASSLRSATAEAVLAVTAAVP